MNSVKERKRRKMEVIKNYRDNKALRDSFNRLAEATFGLNFENWYQVGYWGDNYNPYSIVVDGEVVSNVSVNITKMRVHGEDKFFIQLGTVMTYEEHRNKGYVRRIMEEIWKDYEEIIDGAYLFANDSVCEFYPKFGFEKSKEFEYSKSLQNVNRFELEARVMNSREAWNDLVRVIDTNVLRGQIDMVGNSELVMFYVTQFMQEEVYYHSETDTYVIAEISDGEAFIHNVFSSTLSNLEPVFEFLGSEIKKVSLGFTPLCPENYQRKELQVEDCTFFIRGKDLKCIEEEGLRIPSLAHA